MAENRNSFNYGEIQILEKQAKEAERANILKAFEISMAILDRRHEIGAIGNDIYGFELQKLADNLKNIMIQ